MSVILAILIVLGSIIFLKKSSHLRIKDIRSSNQVTQELQNKIVGYGKIKRAQSVPMGAELPTSLMHIAFDSIITKAGYFDYIQYPNIQVLDIFKGSRNEMLCGEISSFYEFLLKRFNIETRIIQLLGNNYVAGKDAFDTHVGVEYKLPGQERWVFADVTFDAYWACDEELFISYLDIVKCLNSKRKLTPIFVRADSKGREKLSKYPTKPEQVFYAGRAVERNFLHYDLNWFLNRLKGESFQLRTNVVYEVPYQGVFNESQLKYK